MMDPRTPDVSVNVRAAGATDAIAGVATSTAAFVGPWPEAPGDGAPVLVTDLRAVDAAAGAGRPLPFTDGPLPPYIWHAARRFFEEGGTRLYLVPVPPRADGARPRAAEYASALTRLDSLDEVAMVAAPGSTAAYPRGHQSHADAIAAALVAHAEGTRHRFAILDSGEGQTTQNVRALRATVDSSRAAIYYPWVHAASPVTSRPVALPPSGFVAGVFARVERERGVHKAPANEGLRGAVALAARVTAAEQEILNPEGVNVIREWPGRGIRLWGARTCSGDPEWKYVNVRRFIDYLDVSIDRGLRWVAFEPNGQPLWTRVRGAVEQFLLAEWRRGALVGAKADEAFFVKCDRSTMTQADLDRGRLVCLIGVALMKPAEFVIIRVGQRTADGAAW